MKDLKNASLAMLTILLWSILFLSACAKDDDPGTDDPDTDVIQFNDPLLSALVKSALGLGVSDEVTTSNILQLETLSINAENDGSLSGIADLTGLEHAENLTYLRLSYTSVTDLTPVKDLQKITYLWLNDTPVTDLSPLSGYTELTYLNLNTATEVTDISPLANNAGLQEAILRNVPMGNAGMTTIRQFTSLYRLNMRATGVTDLSLLGALMADGALLDTTPGAAENEGATLDVRELNVTDWSPIEPYVNQITNLDGYPE